LVAGVEAGALVPPLDEVPELPEPLPVSFDPLLEPVLLEPVSVLLLEPSLEAVEVELSLLLPFFAESRLSFL